MPVISILLLAVPGHVVVNIDELFRVWVLTEPVARMRTLPEKVGDSNPSPATNAEN
jgi:hypothetical protein